MLFDRDRFREIVHTLASNKRRTLATAFGVFWGILMLVVLLSVSAGFKNGFAQLLRGISANSGVVWQEKTTKPYKGFRKGRAWRMNSNDLLAVRAQVPEVSLLSPMTYAFSSVSYGDKNGRFMQMGVVPDYFQITPPKLVSGRLLNELDELEKRKTCLIGEEVRDRLFGKEDPISKRLKVGSSYFTVVGVVGSNGGASMGVSAEHAIFICYPVLQQLMRRGDEVNTFCFMAHPSSSIQEVLERITTVLKLRNDIAPDDDAAIGSVDTSSLFSVFDMMLSGLDILIWIVGVGTLLAGIIGVTNILLVTVRERTREIGVKRAVGAKPKDIIIQLFSESLFLTAIAGLIGLSLGVLLMAGVGTFFSQPGENMPFYNPTIPFSTAIISLLIIIVGGMLGGLLPAWRAVQIKAIDAMRDE